jgi:hypothetical protein
MNVWVVTGVTIGMRCSIDCLNPKFKKKYFPKAWIAMAPEEERRVHCLWKDRKSRFLFQQGKWVRDQLQPYISSRVSVAIYTRVYGVALYGGIRVHSNFVITI